jgi:multicomponent Na+:H+ antiporter subunit G
MAVSIAVDALLGAAVGTAWLGALAFVRLQTPFEQLHVVTFINLAALGMAIAAAFVADGLSSRSLKCALIFVTVLCAGSLLAHVTGRALHLREGERR